MKNIIQKLLIIKEQVKVEKKGTHRQGHENYKHLKNSYCVHNGSHKWDDCRENLENRKSKKGNHNNNNDNDNQDKCGNGP